MEPEKRVIVGVTLTQLMYTIFMVISDGTIIFATPLNPILFGFTALYFSILNIKKRGMTLLMLILGFLSIISSPLFFEILLSGEQLTNFYATPLPDLVSLSFALTILIFAGLVIYKQASLVSRILMMSFIIVFAGLQVSNNIHLLVFPYFLSLISSQLDKQLKPFHMLWILLFIFEFMGAINQILH